MPVEATYGMVKVGNDWFVTYGNKIVAGPFSSATAHYYSTLWHSKYDNN